MKTLLTIALILTFGLFGSSALAFHDGGVADCAGCHTMHNSQDGALVDADSPDGNAYLLNDATPSDTCLGCHAERGIMDGGNGMGPGGDYYWLTRSYTWSAHGHDYSSTGDSHGHNINAPGHGIVADVTLTEAPGGDFLGMYLGCTSCHDPHGNTNFRLLYGAGAGPKYDGIRYAFTNPAPIAFGNSYRVNSAGGYETNEQHTAYQQGMSEWCSNCHTEFLNGTTAAHRHVSGTDMGSTIASAYNAYISTASPVGGLQGTAYMGLVPFENVDATEADRTSTEGPTAADQVMCLTCHRAHASAFPDIARWDMGETLVLEGHPSADSTDPDEAADGLIKYYSYSLDTNQRSLCNKCHQKDLGDDLNP